jgi:CubicO group peptidase (beta-lactamase class C family)
MKDDRTPTITMRLDGIIDQAVSDGVIVGADVLVAQDNNLVYRKAAGWLDREARLPMPVDAIFRFSSLTKPIVSSAALILVERGILRLDDEVTEHLPEFQPRLPSGASAQITIRQLLTHTAGLTYGFFQSADGPYRQAGISDGFDASGVTIEDNLRRISQVPLSYVPGERWGYSVATDVLGGVMEKVADARLEAILRDLVLDPLDMCHTSFHPPGRSNLAVPYIDGAGSPQRMTDAQVTSFGEGEVRFAPDCAWEEGSFQSGGSGLFGTGSDYLVFLEAIRSGGIPIMSRDSASLLTGNAIGDLPVDVMGPGWGFGMGAAVLTRPEPASTPQNIGTWHWSGAYGHHWFVDPVERLTTLVMTNTSFAGMVGPFPDAIRDAVYDAG